MMGSFMSKPVSATPVVLNYTHTGSGTDFTLFLLRADEVVEC
jgi:hypothetical protein